MNPTGWPFRITVDGELERGMPAELEIELSQPLTEANFTKLRYVVESFAALGEAGGLGGDRVPPMQSTVLVTKSLTTIGVARASWRFGTIAIDPRGLGVLFNALAFLVEHIVSVSLFGQHPGNPLSFGSGDLPPAWAPIGFSIDDDRTGASVELTVELAQPLVPMDADLVLESVQVWLDCGSIRGYADAASGAGASILAPTEHPAFEITGDTLSGTLDDSGVHEGCYDILINVLQKVHAIAPITELVLE